MEPTETTDAAAYSRLLSGWPESHALAGAEVPPCPDAGGASEEASGAVAVTCVDDLACIDKGAVSAALHRRGIDELQLEELGSGGGRSAGLSCANR